MIEITGPEQVAAWRARELPPVEQLSGGLWSVPVPLPNVVLRYVLVYVLELADGIAIIDAGWDTEPAWDALRAGIEATGHGIADVRAVLVTHIHRDHYGLAARVREASGAWIGMHELEAADLPRRSGGPEALLAGSRDWLTMCGAPADQVDELAGSPERFAPLLALPEPDRLIADGERVDLPGWQLRAVWTPGHTPGHLCFHEQDREILFTGDHILPRISPNISMRSTTFENPLADYLASLAAVSTLPADEVMPAHEYRFRGLAERTGQLQDHHRTRLAELLELVRTGPERTAWELTIGLSWSRPWSEIRGFMRRSALGETHAHLALLQSRGLVEHSSSWPQRWRIAPSA